MATRNARYDEADITTICRAGLFQGLDAHEIETILPCLEAHADTYDAHAYVWRYGASISSVGLVLAGSVQILEEDFWGNRNILAQMEAGNVFGESYACVPESRLQVSVLANTACRILFMDIHKLACGCAHVCTFHQRLSHNLLAQVARKNLMLTAKIGHISKRTTRAKLLSYLSAQAQQVGGFSFDIPFNRQQLADYLSVDRSALSSELGTLRDEGVIAFHKNHFELKHA